MCLQKTNPGEYQKNNQEKIHYENILHSVSFCLCQTRSKKAGEHDIKMPLPNNFLIIALQEQMTMK